MARATRCRDGDLRRDERISVAVASNPGSESERHRESKGIRRPAELFLERHGERRLHVRASVEQSRLEIPERGAHLVEHGRPVLPDLAREPEELDFALERLLDQTHFVGGGRFAREQIVGDARLQTEQCAARRFGGVRGEHGTDVERAASPARSRRALAPSFRS